MDGNGRWAQAQGKARIFGHQCGAKRVRELVETAGKAGVRILTLYAFSEENWRRPAEEVNSLFSLLVAYLKQELEHLQKNRVRLRSIGSIEKLPTDCQEWLRFVEEETSQNDGLQLVLALSYSGRCDLVRAIQGIASQIKMGNLEPGQIDETLVSRHLSTQGLPDPDLLIRTSGEQRLSNFLLWEMAYTEFFFTSGPWPEFSGEHFIDALRDFTERERRFGTVKQSHVNEHRLTEGPAKH
jgi:undecaprenyl diphosphate synthase